MGNNQNYKATKKINIEKVKYYLSTLFKNEPVKELGLKEKIYKGLILAVVSALISVIPLVVHTAQQNGSDLVSTNALYNYDQGWYSFLEDASKNGYTIKFDTTNHNATLEGKKVSIDNNYLVYEHVYKANDGHSVDYKDFQVYYIPKEASYNDVALSIANEATNSLNGRDTSFIIFGYSDFSTSLYKYGTYSYQGGFIGNYLYNEDVKDIKEFYVTNKATYLDNVQATLDNFKPFLDNAFTDYKIQAVWTQFGIGTGLNFSITLIMGLVLFLLTRGKNNPNRGIKFLQTLNMSFWAAPSPAILALIFGFILKQSQYDLMIFVVLFGFRVMWLSMKQLPNYPSDQK